MPSEWVEKALEWRVKLLGPVTNPSGESLDGKIEASLAALLEEVTAEQRQRADDCCRMGERTCAELVRERDEARAEVERLRGVLQRIVDRLDYADKINRPVDGLGVAMGHDARAALRGGE